MSKLLTYINSSFFSILFLTYSAVEFLFSKVKIIFNAKLDAKKRLNFPLGTCFLYKILAPQGERRYSPQVSVFRYVADTVNAMDSKMA